MNFVTDTHSLVWNFTEDHRLGKKALNIFEQTVKEGRIIVPTIILAEIMFIAKRGRITLTFKETLKKREDYENFNIVPLDIEILKITDNIEAEMEMHDKLIVATALYYEAKLIAKDKCIGKSGAVKTIW
ncbi:MAG: type II toxin-antitoxin system VapC family toxin [bacterium]